jgi:putative sigma-54 modulation protein
MRLELTGRKVAISPGLRRVVDQKLGKLLRRLNDSGISAAVVVSKEKVNNVVELSLHARGERYLNAIGKATTWEQAVADAVEKVQHQAEKAKGRWEERRKRGESARSVKRPRRAAAAAVAPVEAAPEPPVRRIKRSARYAVKPMTADEAAMELEGRDDTFLVFRDARSNGVQVIYRRKDGHLGLIEPDA